MRTAPRPGLELLNEAVEYIFVRKVGMCWANAYLFTDISHSHIHNNNDRC